MSIIYFSNDSFMSKAHCYWPIEDFGINSHEQLISREFGINTTKNVPLKWRLRVLTKGSNESYKDYVSLYLTLLSDITPDVEVKYEFSITDSEKKRTNIYRSINFFGKTDSYGCDTFIKRDVLFNESNNLLIRNRLIIVCDITIFNTHKNPISKLTQDFQDMFYNKKYSDIEFDVDGHNIPAHKIILVSRSNVFAAKFEHEMLEAKTNRVVITDINHEVFAEMLHFIYTGQTPNLVEMAHDLLAAADKYNLEELKVMCEETLCKKLCIEIAAETLILADLHSCDQLKAQTIDYINSYAIEVIETKAWQDMIKTHGHLIAETYRAVTLQQTGFPKKGQMAFINLAKEDFFYINHVTNYN